MSIFDESRITSIFPFQGVTRKEQGLYDKIEDKSIATAT